MQLLRAIFIALVSCSYGFSFNLGELWLISATWESAEVAWRNTRSLVLEITAPNPLPHFGRGAVLLYVCGNVLG